MRKATLHGVVAAAVLVGAWSHAATLTDFNVVVTGTLNTRSHVDGRTFTNNLQVTNSPVFAMHPSAGTGDTLTIAGNVTGNSMHVNRGVVRTRLPLPAGFQLNNATAVVDPSVSIADLASKISSASAYYRGLTGSESGFAAGSISVVEGKRLVFTAGTAAAGKTAVFQLNASQLGLNNLEFSFNLGSATSAIINVIGGSTLNPSPGHFLGSWQVLAPRLMWNFADATTLNLQSTWVGSILGPGLTVNSNNQNIEGGVYVMNFNQTGEVHSHPFGGPLPPDPSPGPNVIPLPSALMGGLALLTLPMLARARRWRADLSRSAALT